MAEPNEVSSQSDIDASAVEYVMQMLMTQQVEIIERFNRPLRDEYLDQLRDHVRAVLEQAFAGAPAR